MNAPTPEMLVAKAWEQWMTDYSQAQRIFLLALPMVTGGLSFLGSGLILLMLYKRGSRKHVPDRIFAATSSVDVVVSLWNVFGAFAVPSETGAPLAKGTWGTCAAAGFFTNFMYAVGSYNVFFLLYVLLRIRYRLQEQAITKSIEMSMHFAAFLVPFITGILALVYQAYNPLGGGFRRCYVVPYPPMCKVFDACTRGGDIDIAVVFSFTPTAILVIVLFVLVAMIFITARSAFRWSSSRFLNNNNNQKAMAKQSILYGIFFFNTYIWTVLLPSYSMVKRSMGQSPVPPYWMTVCFEIFWPLQGFSNFILFSQFRFCHIRRARRDMSIFWVMKETVFGAPYTSAQYRRRQPARVGSHNNNDNNAAANCIINVPNQVATDASHASVPPRRQHIRITLSEGAFSIGDYVDLDIMGDDANSELTTDPMSSELKTEFIGLDPPNSESTTDPPDTPSDRINQIDKQRSFSESVDFTTPPSAALSEVDDSVPVLGKEDETKSQSSEHQSAVHVDQNSCSSNECSIVDA